MLITIESTFVYLVDHSFKIYISVGITTDKTFMLRLYVTGALKRHFRPQMEKKKQLNSQPITSFATDDLRLVTEYIVMIS